MDDVCSADDDKCKKPNLSGVGMIEKGKCSLTGVLLRFRPMTLLDCAKKCFITSQCTSINYRQNWKLCDLVMSNDDGNEMADDSTCIRSNITTWQKSLAGKCADHNCEEGQKCEFNADGNNFKCVEAYCKGLPSTPNAAVDERFGLRRNLDTGNKYKCDSGYKMKGNPFAVCQSPGDWKVLFNCTKKVTCSAEGYKYDAEMHIKLESSPLKWADAQQNCQQQGGNLIRITTKNKWDSIILYLKDLSDNIIVQLNGVNSQQTCGLINTQQTGLEDENCNSRYISFFCENL
ncbi:unnamed protein product [Mytilus edulis]|uniref:Sushi domain-containing protein n=1 Tax=Mytilus edulis TaxID=6550 RepID=A0A8S3PLN8_MYTED|nr:unnamed protein product [Mytilus edulis]